MKKLFQILFLILALPAIAAQQVTLTITFTNAPAVDDTVTVNSDVRTWTSATNVASSPSTLISTNVANTAKSNAWSHFAIYPVGSGATRLVLQDTGSNTLAFIGQSAQAIAATISGTWGFLTLSTNTLGGETIVRVPIAAQGSAQRTNITSDLLAAISLYSTSAVAAASDALSNHVNTTEAQTVTGAKTFGVLSATGGTLDGQRMTNVTGLHGTVNVLTGGLHTSAILLSPTLTNGINYGNAFSSRGSGTYSEQFGYEATATAERSVAIGTGATATNVYAVALGYNAFAYGESSVSVGAASEASGVGALAYGPSTTAAGENSLAIGYQAQTTVNGTNSIAIGQNAAATNSNTIVIGSAAYSTASDQVVFGGASQTVLVPGVISSALQTNSTLAGTNQVSGDWAWSMTTVDSLANGVNAAVPVTGTFISLTAGPTAAFSINGLAGGRGGRWAIVENATGQACTIAHDSGADATAANRIYVPGAADGVFTGRIVFLFTYNATASRWQLVSPIPGLTTNVMAGTGAGTNELQFVNGILKAVVPQ